MSGLTILLIDDDTSFSAEIAEYLGRYAFDVACVESLAAGTEALRRQRPDLVILDQFLGKADALEALPDMRQAYDGPLMILTGNADATDRIKGLEIGADDFVSKTLPPRELLARVRALSRRVRPGAVAAHEPAPHASSVQPGIDTQRRSVIAPDGSQIDLTTAEYEMMRLLAAEPGTPVSRETLCRLALKRPLNDLDRSVDNVVAHLRRKLAPFGRGAGVIVGVRGVGYAFTGFGVDAVPVTGEAES